MKIEIKERAAELQKTIKSNLRWEQYHEERSEHSSDRKKIKEHDAKVASLEEERLSCEKELKEINSNLCNYWV